MINIIKSQNYQLRHDIFSVVAVLICLVVAIVTPIMDGLDAINGGTFLAYHFEMYATFWTLISLVFCGRIAAWDYNDKTINYELMSGHSRKDIFFGRLISSVIWCFLLCYMTLIIPMVICMLVGGWGDNADFSGVLMRIVLTAFPLMRLVAEFFLLAMLLRNCYVTYALGYVLIGAMLVVTLIISEFLGLNVSCLLGYQSLTDVLDISNSQSQMINGIDVMVYKTALEMGDVTITIVSGFLVSILCIMVAYVVFKKRDMH